MSENQTAISTNKALYTEGKVHEGEKSLMSIKNLPEHLLKTFDQDINQ
jgi:hypothetical protein